MTSWDVEEVDVEELLEEVVLEEEVLEEDVDEVDEEDEVARGTTFAGTLAVGKLKILTVAASVLEEVDSADEELLVDVGTGSPVDNTLPHGSSPKTWPVQPQRERQELTQFAPPQKACTFGCCCLEPSGSLLVSYPSDEGIPRVAKAMERITKVAESRAIICYGFVFEGIVCLYIRDN